MGQTSSQVGYLGRGAAQTSQSKQLENGQGESSQKKKSKRKYKTAVEGSDREEETARALLQLKGDVPSPLDDSAASNFLSALQGDGEDIREGHGSDEDHERGEKRRTKKRKQHEFKGQGEMFHSTQDHPGQGSHKRAKHSNSTKLFNGQPTSSQSLSHHDFTADETVARYPQESENEVASAISIPRNTTRIHFEPPIQPLATAAYPEWSDSPPQPSSQPPSLGVTRRRPSSYKKQRKSRKHALMENNDGAGQEEADVAGQHAFDEYFNQPQLDSANLFDQYADVTTPIDPDLVNEPGAVMSVGEDPLQYPEESVDTSARRASHKKKRKSQVPPAAETMGAACQEKTNGAGQHAFGSNLEAFGECFNQPQLYSANLFVQRTESSYPIDPELINKFGAVIVESLVKNVPENFEQHYGKERLVKGVRVYSPKGKPADVDPFLGTSIPPDDQQEVTGEEQQDRALSASEELPRHSLDASSLKDRSTESEGSICSSRLRRNKTPPPLAKASKPRGNKTQQGGKKAKNYDPPLEQVARKGGVFTKTEIAKLDAFRDTYCRENQVTQSLFNQIIQSPARGHEALWSSIHEVIPYRTRMSSARFCRRRYHNFSARGVWTQSEDENLKQAVAAKGKSWKVIGEMIGRHEEDCRDRYRNYFVNAQHRNREQWTEAEVSNLCRAVHDCMMAMKEERKRTKMAKFQGREVPESELESDSEAADMKLINWQTVSDCMGPVGGGRSRLQCSSKWGSLKMEQRKNYLKEVDDILKGKKAPQPHQNGKTSSRRKGWRLSKAHKTLNNMKAGDRFDFLQAFSGCRAIEEGNIPWKHLGNEDFRSRWTVSERKAALEKFKNEIPRGSTMGYRDVVNKMLTNLMAVSGDRLSERWDRKYDVDVNVAMSEQRSAERNRKNRKRELVSKFKSNDLVDSSDCDEEEYIVETMGEEEVLESGVADTGCEEENRANDEASADSSRQATDNEEQEDIGVDLDVSPVAETRKSIQQDAVATDDDEAREDKSTEEAPVDTEYDSLFGGSSADTDDDSLFGEYKGLIVRSAAASDDEMREDQPNEEAGPDHDHDSVFGELKPSLRSASPDENKTQEDSPDEDASDASPSKKTKPGAPPNEEGARIVRINESAVWKAVNSPRSAAKSPDAKAQEGSSNEDSSADTEASPESSDEDSDGEGGFSLGQR